MSHFARKTKRKNDLEIKTYRLNVLPAIFKLRHYLRFNVGKKQNHLTFITRLFVTINLYIMKTLMLSLILAATLTGGSIYDFKVPGLDGTNIDFSKYKGKKIMIVNTASM